MTRAQPCQVLVVGAGPAGTLAAIAAARAGVETILVEQAEFPGGLGRTQFHRHVCGFFVGDGETPGPVIHGPLVQELQQRLARQTPLARPLRMGRVWVWPLAPEQWTRTLGEWIRDTPSLRFLPRRRVAAFVPAERSAGTVQTEGVEGALELAAEAIVDASGTARLAALAGWELEEPGERQLAGCTLRLRDVEPDDLLPFRVPDCLRRAAARGAVPLTLRYTTFVAAGEGLSLLRLNLPAETSSGDAAALAGAALDELRRACAPFGQARLDAIAPIEPRDGPRVLGRYRLTGADVRNATRFDDAVARGAWPGERWTTEGPRYDYPRAGRSYDVPLRCLQTVRSERVLFAGRCLSADDTAAAALRVMGIAAATGEAAGRQAARRSS